jgi:hypothetical protein
MVARTQQMQALIYFVARLLGLSENDTVLDWGGGNGLLVRMLRDAGLQAYLLDKYVANHYAVGFEDDSERHHKLILAFEVWEHLAHPKIDVAQIFDRRPDAHLLSTLIYKGQGEDWSYLHPESGKHVFFYTERAMFHIAKRFGYEVLVSERYTVFLRSPISRWKSQILRFLLPSSRHRWLRPLFGFVPKNSFTDQDFDSLIKRGLI